MGRPDAAHRVLRIAAYEEWERAGRSESGKGPGEGRLVGTLQHAGMEMPPLLKSPRQIALVQACHASTSAMT